FGAAAATAASAAAPDLSSARADFPRALRQTYLDGAAHHPLSKHTAAGVKRYMDYHMHGPGDGRGEYFQTAMNAVKPMFAKLINAKPSEIALVHCTKAGENIVFNGLNIQASGANVVTNDLHYAGSVHSYTGRAKHGLDLRIVRARDWAIRLENMEAVIDKKTRLVAITLVSNVNGHIEDAKAISEIAHAKGAYVYADIIQAAGVVPIDVQALGIDFAACSNYKWLQGLRGAGFLYVREGLQGTVVRDLLYPGYVRFNYPPWVTNPDPAQEEFPFEHPSDAGRYQPGNVNLAGYLGQYETFRYMERIGIARMLDHAVTLAGRIRKGLPASRYRCITPLGMRTPIVTFIPSDLDDTRRRLKKANIQVTTVGNRMRVSPSVYNNNHDVDRLLEALA
ncbi:MAG: aminotransferase class V-fold PLP-dependent enzyme, partial [bacterium]|nr:aminotransferase class V-fold PLP-dependent enzyme [bacterium]